MKINTTNTTNKNKKRVAITTIMCAMVIFALVIVGCGIKKNSTVAEAEGEIIAEVGATIDTTEITTEDTVVEDTTETTTEIAMGDTSEDTVEPTTETTTETVEVEETEKPSENTTTTPSTTPSENKPSTPSTTETPSVPTHTHNYNATVTNATCVSQGYTTYTCECGDSYVSNYTSGSHNYSNGACTTCGTADPNVQKHWCGTPMQMMSGYIFHPAEGYYAPYVLFSNGDKMPFDGNADWIGDYMFANGITSFTISENHWVETTPEWREENVTQMCCPSCRYADNGFVAY